MRADSSKPMSRKRHSFVSKVLLSSGRGLCVSLNHASIVFGVVSHDLILFRELGSLVNNSCIASHVMFMNPGPSENASDANSILDDSAPIAQIITVSNSSFSPSVIEAVSGEYLHFVWDPQTVASVSAGSCESPQLNIFHSGSFAAPHDFVIQASNSVNFYSRENCSQTGRINVV